MGLIFGDIDFDELELFFDEGVVGILKDIVTSLVGEYHVQLRFFDYFTCDDDTDREGLTKQCFPSFQLLLRRVFLNELNFEPPFFEVQHDVQTEKTQECSKPEFVLRVFRQDNNVTEKVNT